MWMTTVEYCQRRIVPIQGKPINLGQEDNGWIFLRRIVTMWTHSGAPVLSRVERFGNTLDQTPRFGGVLPIHRWGAIQIT